MLVWCWSSWWTNIASHPVHLQKVAAEACREVWSFSFSHLTEEVKVVYMYLHLII